VRTTGPGGLDVEVTMVDADGRVTEDPSAAVWGEIWLLDERGVAIQRDYVVMQSARRRDMKGPTAPT
jgi:hypothetical protein